MNCMFERWVVIADAPLFLAVKLMFFYGDLSIKEGVIANKPRFVRWQMARRV